MPAKNSDPLNPTIRGDKYRQTHKASVTAILGPDTRKVSSRGSRFYNRDAWTARALTLEMCKWSQENPGCAPTRQDVTGWVDRANAVSVPDPEIVIANTPNRLKLRTALALTGGAYHEALHTLYSCRRKLSADEVCGIVLPRWAKVPNWAALHDLIQEWSNIVEDIRIERRGREGFPGIDDKMHDLQDFILHQEAQGLADVRAHAAQAGQKPPKPGTLTVISGAFRDLGLGYQTPSQATAWEGYKQANPQAVDFVVSGPLRPILDEAITLSVQDDLGCLRLALDALVELVQQSQQQQQEDDERDEAQDGQQGDGQQKCKACGAPAHKLVVRPKSDGKGGKVKGVGICTCTVCGHQEEVQVKTNSQPKNREQQLKDAQKGPGPKFEGWDPEDLDEDGSGGGQEDGKGQEDGEGQAGSGTGEDGDDQDPETDGEGDGEGDDAQDGGPQGGQSGKSESDGSNQQMAPQQAPSKGSTVNNSKDPGHHEGNDFADVANEAMGDAQKDKGKTGLLDNNSALEGAVQSEEDQEAGDDLLKNGEQVWRPYDPTLDLVNIVKPSAQGKDHDRLRAQKLLLEMKEMCSFLRARLAAIIRALEQTDVVHGLRKGRTLSPQFLVDSALSVRAGQMPSRAYTDREDMLDTSMAAAVVLDESTSMSSHLTDATKIMLAITEPLERLGVAVQCSGFRDGRSYSNHVEPEDRSSDRFHRFDGKIHDVFKRFDERLQDVLWRFACTRATGSTPMADGIQFGLDGLNYRNEGHRILFIVTDGYETEGSEVINWQVRIAKEAGIHVVGVGMGSGTEYVKTRFPDHVWSPDIHELPKLLVAKLNELIDTRAVHRGRRLKTGISAVTVSSR